MNITVGPSVSIKCGSNDKTAKANICGLISVSFSATLLVVAFFVSAPPTTLLTVALFLPRPVTKHVFAFLMKIAY